MTTTTTVTNGLAEKRPSSQARPALKLFFDNIPGIESIDFGTRMSNVQFSCMLNGGYIVKLALSDPNFNTISQLIESQYLKLARAKPIQIRFQLLASYEGGTFPTTATNEQIAYIVSMNTSGTAADTALVEIVAVDPASYLLNKGLGSGKSYQGNVSSVIQQVINEYAKDIKLEVSKTFDSNKNRFWMMRQDPQSFINSLLEWSTPLTKNKTNWLVASNGLNLYIKEQADVNPRERAFYTFWEPTTEVHDTILGWELLTDNSLSLIHHKIIVQGISAISGAYYDKVTDQYERKTVAKDETTYNKVLAATTAENSYTKSSDTADTNGATSIHTVPEVYSAGDIGLSYDTYIDGTARDLWLNLTRRLIKCRFQVLGHGEWSDGTGLGVDTIRILWMQAAKGSEKDGDVEESQKYFMSGNWLVYGFEHDLNPAHWHTYVYAARYDWDAESRSFPDL